MLTTDSEVNASLSHDGYFVFRDFTNVDEWDDAFACPKVHHYRIWTQIEESMKKLRMKLGWDPMVSKFRASASCEQKTSNATDASEFHRDIACFRGITDAPEIFTLVIYLNKTTMRVIPGSHRTLRIPMHKALRLKTRTVSVNPGDAVLFWASLLHAGSFTNTNTERRVVQCFDVFPNKKSFEEWNTKVCHVWCPTNDKNELISKTVSSLTHIQTLGKIISFAHFLKTSAGYPIREETLPPNFSIISGEAWRKRVSTYDEFQDANVYCPAPGMKIHDADPTNIEALRAEFYKMPTEITVLFRITIGLFVVFILRSALTLSRKQRDV